MEGRYQASIDAARRLVKAVGADAAKMGPFSQLYAFTPMATLLRFGKWKAVLAEPLPPDDQKLTLVIAHLARGFAFADTGDKAGAAAERTALAALVADPVLASYQGLPGPVMAKLALAELDGEIARKAGDLKTAVDDFTMAVGYEEDIPYSEPPYWHQPASHLLGAALLEAGRAKEAAAVYRKSLNTYRLDGWALYGLAQAQDAADDTAGAADTRKEFAQVWQLADVKLTASRF
jgi:tetratricopeptide (TPR) repeat protein